MTHEEGRALLGKYLDGLATGEELSEFSRLLEQEPWLAREFARISILDSRLERAMGRERAAASLFAQGPALDQFCGVTRRETPARGTPVRGTRRPRRARARPRRSFVPMAVAATVLLGALAFVILDGTGRREAPGPVARGETRPRAATREEADPSPLSVTGAASVVEVRDDARIAGAASDEALEPRDGMRSDDRARPDRDGAVRERVTDATVVALQERGDATRARHDVASVEAASERHPTDAKDMGLAAVGDRVGKTDRVVADHEGPLSWKQHPGATPLAFELSPVAHSGRSALRVVYEREAGDQINYGQIIRPLVLRAGDRVLRFAIKVDYYAGNADWNVQVRLRDLSCWKLGGGMFWDVGVGWNLIELKLPRAPENTYGGGTYRPADVQELIFSVCQQSATFLLDDFTIVGKE